MGDRQQDSRQLYTYYEYISVFIFVHMYICTYLYNRYAIYTKASEINWNRIAQKEELSKQVAKLNFWDVEI